MSTANAYPDRCPDCGGLNHKKYGRRVHNITPEEVAELQRSGFARLWFRHQLPPDTAPSVAENQLLQRHELASVIDEHRVYPSRAFPRDRSKAPRA